MGNGSSRDQEDIFENEGKATSLYMDEMNTESHWTHGN